jgi:hypothetical protein
MRTATPIRLTPAWQNAIACSASSSARASDPGLQLGPAREAVAAGDRELCCIKRDPLGDAPELVQGVGVAGFGAAQQVLRLVTELVEVGMSRECRHDVSFTGLRSACHGPEGERHGSLLLG